MADLQDLVANMMGTLPNLQKVQTDTHEEALRTQKALVEAVLLVHQDLQEMITVLKRQ